MMVITTVSQETLPITGGKYSMNVTKIVTRPILINDMAKTLATNANL